ncbi:putative glutathione transferase [Helianthus annuus]|uniref:uncharacterized protein LOC110941254 n=1 Tax=Helianthus annuus TaxID=4232 RepID=UPI000B8F62EC|nr:uncharacterized protein LOC110941254 [Helianthus annuus]KAJ0570586.1 putative glutathione transferase [Helianthus annuus]KAJ0584929.1 putative glutathione transferase [Helianthus annuus]KAJ0750594.1 putative glutathione transferase [Helianthus annuus]KAJ0919352.1 putative glutathione transferase [Helianthus annuus]
MDSQDQGMYYTNLLHGNSIVSLDDSPPLPTNPISIKKSTRGVNFIPEEDKLLVSAWLNHSLDAIQGTDQKYSQLWEKIFEYFQQHKETTTERTIKSLSNRWSCIQKATNSFCSCLAQVERLNQSGMTEQDKFDKAKIMYQSEEKCNFLFEHCWNLLKDQPKWILRDAAKQRKTMVPPPTPTTTPSPSPTRNVIEDEVVELDRPMGKKAVVQKRKAEGKQTEEIIQLKKMKFTLLEEAQAQEKEYFRLKTEKMEYDKKAEDERLRLLSEKLRIEAEKTELAKKESDQRIMMMDMSGMTEIQRLYFEELQKEIVMRRDHA